MLVPLFIIKQFATVNQIKFTSPEGQICGKNRFPEWILKMMKKRSEFCLGSAFFGISDLGFLPYGVPIKGVIEKGLIFDEKCFFVWNAFVMGWGSKNVYFLKNSDFLESAAPVL